MLSSDWQEEPLVVPALHTVLAFSNMSCIELSSRTGGPGPSLAASHFANSKNISDNKHCVLSPPTVSLQLRSDQLYVGYYEGSLTL